MGERELREKYGGKLAKAINRAIRAEIAEGNAALDTLTQLSGPAMHSKWTDRSGNPTPEATAYYKHKREVVDKMENTIRRKWNIPMERESKQKSKKLAKAKRPRRSPST